MLMIPKPVYARYMNQLKEQHVPAAQHQEYLKWLRYYLDFCAKYLVVHDQDERVRLFLKKLRDIRTIQTKLGHASLKTTMIYTHCVPVRTMMEARSPLDLD